MAFQVSLLCPNDVDLSQLTFSSIRLVFSDGRPDVLLSAAAETAGVDYVDLGVVNHQEKHINTGRLSWNPGRRLVINGRLHAELEGEVQVSLWTESPSLTSGRVGQACTGARYMEL